MIAAASVIVLNRRVMQPDFVDSAFTAVIKPLIDHDLFNDSS